MSGDRSLALANECRRARNGNADDDKVDGSRGAQHIVDRVLREQGERMSRAMRAAYGTGPSSVVRR